MNQSSLRMIQFPNCKINLGLSILANRADGYHELETVFYPIAVSDALEILPAADLTMTQSGIAVPGDPAQNLCLKAYHLLKNDFPQLPAVQMHLHKNIPMGAGLGGGSSDGAAALSMLNDLFQLQLSTTQLIQYAAQLGSDCPFFILNEASHATGRGEVMQPMPINLSNFTMALIHPNIPISTGWAFQQITPAIKEKTIASIIQQPIATWKNELINDFEKPVFEAHTSLALIKHNLYEQGAIYASLSGSGSSLFGLFPKGTKLQSSSAFEKLKMDLI